MLIARLLSPTLDMNSIGAGAWKEVQEMFPSWSILEAMQDKRS